MRSSATSAARRGRNRASNLITGPDFAGTVPGDMTEVRLRTKIGVTGLRILAKGAADLP